jgi:hypothetical protein
MTSTSGINRGWIATELAKVIASERALAADFNARAESPPDPSLSVLYHEISAADERHVSLLEAIATRYGNIPTRSEGAGAGGPLGWVREKVAGLGASLSDRLSQDLAAKADAIHRQSAWVHAFEALGDEESALALAEAVTADQTHQNALFDALKRFVEQGARGVTGS